MENLSILQELQLCILYTILQGEHKNLIFKELDESYFDGIYKTLFAAMKEMYLDKQEIDIITVRAKLGEDYLIPLANILSYTVYVSNIRQYIKDLKYQHSKNEAIVKASGLINDLKNNNLSNEVIQNNLLELSKLFNTDNHKYKSVSMKDGLSQLFDEISSQKKKVYYKTGFPTIDKYLLIDKSDYVVIGARPSVGKTTFAVSLAVNLSKNNKVIFFSLETPADLIYQKIVSSAGKINSNHLLMNTLTDDEIGRFSQVSNQLYENNLEVVYAAGMTVNEMQAMAIEKKAQIIIIDYIGLINCKANSQYEKMTKISIDLHTMAQREQICVIALSQLRRLGKNERPTMSDLRESGQIEQDADAVMLLHAPDEITEEEKQNNFKYRELHIAKNKKGSLPSIRLKFYEQIQMFREG